MNANIESDWSDDDRKAREMSDSAPSYVPSDMSEEMAARVYDSL